MSISQSYKIESALQGFFAWLRSLSFSGRFYVEALLETVCFLVLNKIPQRERQMKICSVFQIELFIPKSVSMTKHKLAGILLHYKILIDKMNSPAVNIPNVNLFKKILPIYFFQVIIIWLLWFTGKTKINAYK